jgi:hypothetical protein
MGDVRDALGAAREIAWTPDDPEVLTGKILDRIAIARAPYQSSTLAVFVDRLLDVATLPVFRVVSACILLVAVGSFLWQSMTVIGEVRQLETQQTYGPGSRPVPQVGYAVDVSTVEGLHGTTLLQRMDVRQEGGSVILSGRALAYIKGERMMSPTLHLARALLQQDIRAARERGTRIQSGIRPVICYRIAEGV